MARFSLRGLVSASVGHALVYQTVGSCHEERARERQEREREGEGEGEGEGGRVQK